MVEGETRGLISALSRKLTLSRLGNAAAIMSAKSQKAAGKANRNCRRKLVSLVGGRSNNRTSASLLEAGRNEILAQMRVGTGHIGFREAMFPADDIRSLGGRGGFVKRNQAVGALTSKPTIRSDNEIFYVDVLQRFTDFVGDLHRGVGIERPVRYDANARTSFSSCPSRHRATRFRRDRGPSSLMSVHRI